MKTFTLTIALFISTLMLAGDPSYEKAMLSSIERLSKAQSQEDLQAAANAFIRISKMNEEDWLSRYYAVQAYIYMSFREKDKDLRDAYLNEAEGLLNHILLRQTTNSEAYALQSFMYTARLSVDPMTRGQEYMILSGNAIKKSLEYNPTNPRAMYLLLSNEVGMANFFGEDPTKYCDRILSLQSHWDEYNQVEALHPNWGLALVDEMAQLCNNTEENN